MRKLVVLALLAGLIAAVVPMEAPANHTLAHKVKRLQAKVVKLQRKVNCMRRTGAATFVGYAYYEGTLDPGGGPYPVHSNADDFSDTNWAANFTQAVGGSADYWVVTVNNRRTCRRKFRVISSPYAGRVAMRTTAMMNMRRLSRVQ